MFKLCKYLLTITGEARYGDWIERLAYNGIAATIPMSPDGRVFYYSDYNALGGVKRNHPVGWSCCTGTRPMALADLHDLVYFHGADDLYVNLYVPSTVTWERPGAAGRSSSASSRGSPRPTRRGWSSRCRRKRSSTFGLKLRVPGWLAGPIEVAVNGEPIAAIGRLARLGDGPPRVEGRRPRSTVRLPMKFAVRPLDDAAPSPAMIMRGPVAMAVRSTGRPIPAPCSASPTWSGRSSPPTGEPLTYRPRSGADLLVRPFYAFKQGERYALYLDPNRHSHREARFAGDGWRESEAFRYDDRPGDSATFAFRGTGVRWIGFRFDDAGIAEVRIDDRPVVQVDQYAPRRDEPFEWRSDELPAGEHRITITIADGEAGGLEGAVHQHCRIRGDAVTRLRREVHGRSGYGATSTTPGHGATMEVVMVEFVARGQAQWPGTTFRVRNQPDQRDGARGTHAFTDAGTARALALAIGREGYARIDDYVVLKAEVYDRLRAAADDGLDMIQVGSLVESTMREEDAGDPLLDSYQSYRP